VRTPKADALAKLARPAAAGPSHEKAVTHAVAAHGAKAPIAGTHADVAAVRTRAQTLGAVEKQVAALKRPPAPGQAEGAQPASEAEIAKLIDVLQSKRDDAQDKVSQLAQHCKTAFTQMERHGISLARKVDLLDKKLAELNEAEPASTSSARTTATPARPAVPHRMAALEREISLLKGSQKKAADEALAVASRDKLRELGTWSLAQFGGSVIGAAAHMLMASQGGRVDKRMENSLDAWLHDWRPETPRNRQGRYSTPSEQFTKSLDVTFNAIKDAVSSEATGTDAAKALGRFLHLLSTLECRGFAEWETRRLARHFSVCVVINKLGTQPFFWWRIRRPAAYLTPEKGGHDTEKITVAALLNQVENLRTEFNSANPRTGVQAGEEIFKGARLTTAKNQLNQLGAHLVSNRENFQALLKSVEKQLIEDLLLTSPNEDAHHVTEELGRKIAPNLGPVYGAMIKGLHKEREQLAKAPARRVPAAIAKAEAETSPTSSTGPDRDRLEIQIGRLRGAVLEYQDKHRETFERHATLSGQHLDASDALEDIDRQLDEARQSLQNVREGKRRALGESAARGQQAASLEKDIDAGWREALADPALSRLISPTALARAMKRHLGQTPAQMRARVRKDGQTARTGTFRSGPELLRTLADIAERELDKLDSPLRAGTEEAFKSIAKRHPGGRINALYDHGRTIGHGVRASDAPDAQPARTGTSQYAIDWAEGEGPRISHLHPWVSPY
jgi:AraC-like DNA-binding protein